jgi:glycogenin
MTLVMSDSYLPGAMVLGHSLRDTGTTKSLVALVTLDTVSLDVIDELKVAAFAHYTPIHLANVLSRRLYTTFYLSNG